MKSSRNYSAPYTATSFKNYLADTSLTLATCWRLVAKSGKVVAATSHTRDLTLPAYPNVTFLTTQGVVPSAVDAEAGLSSAGLEADGIFKVDVIDEESVSNGDWDASYFEIFLINYDVPAMGEMVMFAGYIGNVKTYGQRFRAEGRPLSSKAGQEIGQLYTPKCTVRNLGDNRCKVNLTLPAAGDGGVITVNGTVTEGGSNIEFSDSSRNQVTGYFDYGIVEFTSGTLKGKQSEIRSYIGTGTRAASSAITVSDSSWKWSSTNPAGWELPSYNDAGWSPSIEQAVNGAIPWNTIVNFPSGSPAKWIWSNYSINLPNAVNATRYFRKTFTPNVSNATLTITADDNYVAYLNGVQIATGANWHKVQIVTLNLNVNAVNVLAIQATNAGLVDAPNNPGGILAHIAFAPYQLSTGTSGIFKLQTPMSRVIPVGTTYTVVRGCNRTWEVCKSVFGNLKNFRGFPFVPGIEKAYKVNR